MRMVFITVSLLSGLIFSQVPEFVQQYTQRVGGAADELDRIVQHFDDDSRLSGYDRAGALQVMGSNPERLVRDQSTRMNENIVRRDRLRNQQLALLNGGSLVRIWSFVENLDWPLAGRTFEAYQFALPLTVEGAIFFLMGFLVPSLTLWVGALFRRREDRDAYA